MAKVTPPDNSASQDLAITLYGNASSHSYLRKWNHDIHHIEIGKTILRHFGLTKEDVVIEVGAGFGRYTSLLRSLGLRVIACEPDRTMFEELKSHFDKDKDVEVLPLAVQDLTRDRLAGANGICGFHVLHHLTPDLLVELGSALDEALESTSAFKSWFFIEPNRANPLYVLQTLVDPAMSFREERGIWRTPFSRHMRTSAGGDPYVGAIGIFPPRPIASRLPNGAARLFTGIRAGRPRPYHLYRIYGGRGTMT